MKIFNGWELLEKLPEGWQIDKSAGSPLCGYEFCTNGKSVLNGQKRALLFVGSKLSEYKQSCQFETTTKPVEKEQTEYPAKAVNELARRKFEEKLLNDIRVDLMICKIEGWDTTEYIKELCDLVRSLGKRK